MKTAKLQSFLKHIEKAAQIASEHELTLGNGGLVDSLLMGIANEIALKNERRES